MPSRRNPSTTTFFVDSTVGDANPKSMRAARGFPSSGFEGFVNDLNYLSFGTALDCVKYFGPIHTATVPDAGSYADLERRNPLIATMPVRPS